MPETAKLYVPDGRTWPLSSLPSQAMLLTPAAVAPWVKVLTVLPLASLICTVTCAASEGRVKPRAGCGCRRSGPPVNPGPRPSLPMSETEERLLALF